MSDSKRVIKGNETQQQWPAGESGTVTERPADAVVHKAVVAAAMGNAVEWLDYGIFTSGAITGIVGTAFFPSSEDAVLKSLALVAIGFIVRPFGGLILGPLGDKLGRRRVLALTIILMSLSTFLVGVLPDYQTVGVAAPLLLLLLRLVQGFSTGGEYGGAATFISEYAPTESRGFFGSFLELGTLTGYVTGNCLVLIVSLAAGAEALHAWAWRIPFLLALPLGVVGLYLRSRLEDTPAFRLQSAQGRTPDKAPLKETLVTDNRSRILNLMGIVFLLNIADYMLLTTMPSYFVEHLHIDENTSLVIIIVAQLVQMALIAPLGALSDRIGRKPLLLAAAIGFLVLSYPAIQLMQAGTLVKLLIGFGLVAFLLVLMLAVIGSAFPAIFPTRVRYGSFAIGYNLSTSLFGGTCGVVTEALIQATADKNWPAYYLMAAGAVAIVPILLIAETAQVPIDSIDRESTATLRK
jgi:MFS transporter, MHS family, proline/betaine transporter